MLVSYVSSPLPKCLRQVSELALQSRKCAKQVSELGSPSPKCPRLVSELCSPSPKMLGLHKIFETGGGVMSI